MTKIVPVKACPITQPQASGTEQVYSRSTNLPLPTFDRKTRTAQKAAQPLPPQNNPPTHPVQSLQPPVQQPTHPSHPIPALNLPSISQLRDFPNLSTPIPIAQKSVIVHLPNSAPSSPIPTPFSFLNIESGEPVTPSSQVSVILPNPAAPLPPYLPPRSSTPCAGLWDNYSDNPSYQASDSQFWHSRISPRKVQLVSTDISEIGDISSLTALR